MNSIKTLVTLAILAAIGVGLYVKLNAPDPEPPKEATGTWDAPPPIEMGNLGGPSNGTSPGSNGGTSLGGEPGAPGGNAPAYVPTSPPGGSAPAFTPSAPGGQAPPFGAPPAVGTSPTFNTKAQNDVPPTDANAAVHPQSDPFVQKATAAGPVTAPEGQSFDEVWAQARQMLDRRDLAGAHLLLSEWYRDPSLSREAQYELTKLLGELAGTVIYSPEHHLEPAYRPAPGETLEQIATRYSVSPELLAKINGIVPGQPLPANCELKVVRGPFMAVVDVPQREMILVLNRRYAGRFTIGMGKEAADAEGEYKVTKKYPNPTYYGANEIIKADDPRNPLGEHWLGLGKPLENSAALPLGIHGTNDPASIRQDIPQGFIRLVPADANDAYDILTVGSTVLIRR